MNHGPAIERLASALVNMVTRGKLALSVLGASGLRTMINGTGLAGETHQGIELLLPYGMSARPVGQTADYLLFQIAGARDHKVAIGCDDPALRIPDLVPGEFGFRNNRTSQIVWRQDKIEVTATLDDIDVTAAVGNVNVLATEGTISLSAKGGITINGMGGNLALSVTGDVTMAATGTIALTAPANQITANGHVLG